MALDRTKLERVAGGLQKLFIYNAGADAQATVTAAGYFNTVTNELDKGDIIIANCANATVVVVLLVTSVRGAASVTTVAHA